MSMGIMGPGFSMELYDGRERVDAVVVWKGAGMRIVHYKPGLAAAWRMLKYRLSPPWLTNAFWRVWNVCTFLPRNIILNIRHGRDGPPRDPDGWNASGIEGNRRTDYNARKRAVRVNGREFQIPDGRTLLLLVEDEAASQVATHSLDLPPGESWTPSAAQSAALRSRDRETLRVAAEQRREVMGRNHTRWLGILDAYPPYRDFMAECKAEFAQRYPSALDG